MIIGIHGKIGSGKDTVAKIIQTLTISKSLQILYPNRDEEEITTYILNNNVILGSDWEVKKFADKLKDMVCLLIGCTREQLEDPEFKNTPLGEEWIRYSYANGFTQDNNGNTSMLTVDCDKERYELELKTNWQTAYKVHYTPRLLLQRLGTEAGRNLIHPNIWVNATMADYNDGSLSGSVKNGKTIHLGTLTEGNKWIITDVRFPNEFHTIKDRKGINIKIIRYEYIINPNNIVVYFANGTIPIFTLQRSEENRINFTDINKAHEVNKFVKIHTIDQHSDFDDFKTKLEHISETHLDDFEDTMFDDIIYNSDSIEYLIKQVHKILIKHKLM